MGVTPTSQSTCKPYMRLSGPAPLSDFFRPLYLGPSASPKDCLSGCSFFQMSSLRKEHGKLCFDPSRRLSRGLCVRSSLGRECSSTSFRGASCLAAFILVSIPPSEEAFLVTIGESHPTSNQSSLICKICSSPQTGKSSKTCQQLSG